MVFDGAFVSSVNMLRTAPLIPWQFGGFMHFSYNYGVQSLKQQMVFVNTSWQKNEHYVLLILRNLSPLYTL